MELNWFKASFSNPSGNCVEIAWGSFSHNADNAVSMRDSKDPEGPVLEFTDAEWDAFLAGVRNREFDRQPA